MTTKKRQIRGERFDVEALATEAAMQGGGNAEKAKQSLTHMGHADPSDDLIEKYAREMASLEWLQNETGAAFTRQIGKIDFSSHELLAAGIHKYLNRRNAGHRARWGASH